MSYELLIEGIDPALAAGVTVAVPPPGTSSYRSLVLSPMDPNNNVTPERDSPEIKRGKVVDKSA